MIRLGKAGRPASIVEQQGFVRDDALPASQPGDMGQQEGRGARAAYVLIVSEAQASSVAASNGAESMAASRE